ASIRSGIAGGLAGEVNRLPAIYGYRQHIEDGGLISYSVDLGWCFHRAASYVHKILQGAQASDLPLEFPTRLQMVINLKAAKALGLAIAPALLARADEVIERSGGSSSLAWQALQSRCHMRHTRSRPARSSALGAYTPRQPAMFQHPCKRRLFQHCM